MIDKINSLIAKIQLSKNKIINEEILKNDEIEDSFINIDNELIAAFNNKKDFELIKALKEILFIISSNSFNKKSAFHIGFFIDENDNQEQSPCQACFQGVKDDNDN